MAAIFSLVWMGCPFEMGLRELLVLPGSQGRLRERMGGINVELQLMPPGELVLPLDKVLGQVVGGGQ